MQTQPTFPRKGKSVDFSSKATYIHDGVLRHIHASIDLLCEETGKCTATDVLRLMKVPETNFARTVVIEYAIYLEYNIIDSGRGFAIIDSLAGNENE